MQYKHVVSTYTVSNLRNWHGIMVTCIIAAMGNLTWKHEDQELEVKVEGRPCCGLMLTDGSNDWDIVLGIGGVQQGVESASPRRNF